jgi:hypothetical protein
VEVVLVLQDQEEVEQEVTEHLFQAEQKFL